MMLMMLMLLIMFNDDNDATTVYGIKKEGRDNEVDVDVE